MRANFSDCLPLDAGYISVFRPHQDYGTGRFVVALEIGFFEREHDPGLIPNERPAKLLETVRVVPSPWIASSDIFPWLTPPGKELDLGSPHNTPYQRARPLFGSRFFGSVTS